MGCLSTQCTHVAMGMNTEGRLRELSDTAMGDMCLHRNTSDSNLTMWAIGSKTRDMGLENAYCIMMSVTLDIGGMT